MKFNRQDRGQKSFQVGAYILLSQIPDYYLPKTWYGLE